MPQPHTLGWSPERTWVFVVGTLEWKHAEYFDPFPKENRIQYQGYGPEWNEWVASKRIRPIA